MHIETALLRKLTPAAGDVDRQVERYLVGFEFQDDIDKFDALTYATVIACATI